MNVVEVFKALSDHTRLRITALVWTGEDLCACEIESILGLSQSNASRHLTRLVQADLLSTDKRGQWVHYSIKKEVWNLYTGLAELLTLACRQDPKLRADRMLLQSYRESGFTCTTIRTWEQQQKPTLQQFGLITR